MYLMQSAVTFVAQKKTHYYASSVELSTIIILLITKENTSDIQSESILLFHSTMVTLMKVIRLFLFRVN
jgi:hypothetical protein